MNVEFYVWVYNNINMKKAFLLTIFISLLLLLSAASSHQPRIVSDEITFIENPEVSQAFYGNLKGKPDYYKIRSEEEFKLYVGILVPDLENIDKDVSVEVFYEHGEEENDNHEDKPVILLNGLEYNWTRYFEEFAGDHYYSGPEKSLYADAGTYNIKVYSPDNEGKYALVVGEKEEFSLNEIINTILTLPALKKDFFEKSPLTAYFNLIGVFLIIFIVLILAVAVAVYKISKKFLRKDKGK